MGEGACDCRLQQRPVVLDTLELELQEVVSFHHACQELNSSLLQEQQVPLTAEPHSALLLDQGRSKRNT